VKPTTVTPPSPGRNITILQRPDDDRDPLGDHRIFKILKILSIKMERRARPARFSQRRLEAGAERAAGAPGSGRPQAEMIFRFESTSCG
jgi:hypothetical protein